MKKFVLILVGVGVGLLLAEVGSRMFIRTKLSHFYNFYRFHSVLGWEKIPNRRGYKTPEGKFSLQYNSKGLRENREYSYKKPEGIYRILCIGDSFTEGTGVLVEQTVAKVLEKKLNKEFSHQFEVINAGTGGYSTAQELFFFQEEGKKYNPDLVILAVCVNDVYDNNHRTLRSAFANPFFSLVNNELKLVLSGKESGQGKAARAENLKAVEFIKKWLRDHSRLYILIVDHFFVKFPRLMQTFAKLGLIHPTVEFTTAFCKEEGQEAWLITEKIIARLNKTVQKEKAKLLIYLIPNQAQVESEDWEIKKKYYSLKESNWDLRKPNKKLKSACAELGIDFIDPLDTLLNETQAGKRLYYEQEFFKFGEHWNKEGHRLVAELTYAYLLKQKLIPL